MTNATRSERTGKQSAPQWRLVWWKFRQHRLAMAGALVTLLIYLVALFAEFLAPVSTGTFDPEYTYAPPQRLHLVDTSDGWDLGLHVYGYEQHRDPDSLEPSYTVDESRTIEIGLFVKGEEYDLFGLIPWDRHLIGPKTAGDPFYLLGADRNGRDLLSRIIHGTRVSMTIGLVGVTFSFFLGVVLGGISGYIGGRADLVIQRLVEFFMSIPSIPLWLGLAAALPQTWGPVQRYFAITVILAMIGWTDLARVVRGRFLSLRGEDFVTSAHLDGCTRPRVIFGHMLPSFTSHLIASVTLSIPAMILAETALSFLGLGLQAPVVSWGVLLQEAQNVRVLATAPWLMLPGLAVIVAVLSLNFAGDGLRDAADPYKK
ncbi:ABC transporter permease [Phytoactinopolyspora alkaliphila]|uniref:ABC transporter permease n=1 Tax=Phytoactinopolyspora alkaliphila TaxID=1783498 RepID=A0A6N9YN08_9ACTN|nr:ABC transporter permease [Phytoactinopolyspora alkaliphila]NED96300.1 ABC transporter permease [Phytoactinopolyspora alkaliphila]